MSVYLWKIANKIKDLKLNEEAVVYKAASKTTYLCIPETTSCLQQRFSCSKQHENVQGNAAKTYYIIL